MRVTSAILIAIILSLDQHGARADQNLDFNPYPMPSGAPVAEVTGIVEDTEGAIWIATWGEGLHRIHETEWTTFTEADGLPDDWIRSLCPSSSGGVWVGTGDGAALIREGLVQTVTPETLPILPHADIFFVGELNDGQVWISAKGGWILVRDPEKADLGDASVGWRLLAGPEKTNGCAIYQVLEAAPGEVLISLTNYGLAWMRNGAWEQDSLPVENQWFIVYSAMDGGRKKIYAHSQDGAIAVQREGDSWVTTHAAPSGIRSVAVDKKGHAFAATALGLFEKTTDGWLARPFPKALGIPFLQQICISQDGALWMGGAEGLYRATTPLWVAPSTASEVRGLLRRTRSSDPVLGMNGSGEIYRFEAGEWTFKYRLAAWEQKDWQTENSIWMGDGSLWFRNHDEFQWLKVDANTLYRADQDYFRSYDIASGKLIREEGLPENPGHSGRFFVTSDARLWSLTDQQLFQLEGASWQPYPKVDGYVPTRVSSILEDNPGEFWVGLEDHIEHWVDDQVLYIGAQEGVEEGDAFHAISQTRSGDIWFGSMGSGVYRYDGHRFQHFTTENGLYRNTVRSIYEASDGTIWIAYRGTGVSSYKSGHWVDYSFEHGLPNASILGFAEPVSGDLWVFATDQRLYQYVPDTLAPDTEILVGPRSVDAYGVGVFSFGGRDAWNQSQSRDLRYSWRMLSRNSTSPENNLWSPFSTAITVASDSLLPGEYQFEVRSSDENGNVDPTPASMIFHVAPPLWLKPVFYIPVVLSLLLATVAMAFRHRSHRALLRSEAALRQSEIQLKAHGDNLEALVLQRTQDLEKAQVELIKKDRLATLGQLTATVSHELRNPLGTIQSTLFTVEKRVAGKGLNLDEALQRMARSVRRCDHIIEEMLDFTRSHAIETQVVDLDSWLEATLQEIGVPDEVELEFALDSGTCVAIDHELMRRVFINLLDNAVQAMEEGGAAQKRIRVLSAIRGKHATIQLDDTGPGLSDEALEHIFDPLFSTKSFGVGLGTNIVKNILDRHEGYIKYSNVPGSGARVALTLPHLSSPM